MSKFIGTRWAAGFLLAVFLAGCATQKIDWAGRVGQYTFDQAVLDFGPPDKQAKISDGTIVAEWMTYRGQSYARSAYVTGYPRWHHGLYPDYVETSSPDYFLRLIFGPDGWLKSWKNFAR